MVLSTASTPPALARQSRRAARSQQPPAQPAHTDTPYPSTFQAHRRSPIAGARWSTETRPRPSPTALHYSLENNSDSLTLEQTS